MVPENIRYGITITPPDGEPVTGTAVPEWDASRDFALVGQFGVASKVYYAVNNPNSWIVSAPATGPSVTLENGYYYFKIIFDKLDSSLTAVNVSGAITKSFDVSTITSSANRHSCMGPPAQYETFEFGATVNGTINFSVSGNSNAYWAITIIVVKGGVEGALESTNISNGVVIDEVEGTMSVESASGFIGFVQMGVNSSDSKCLATKSNFNWAQSSVNTNVNISQSTTFSYIKGALIGSTSASGEFNYTGGQWSGPYGTININNLTATTISGFNCKNWGSGSGFILKVGNPVIPE